MNPFKYSQMMKYLTRAKKANPDLPDVFPASKAPIPAKTQEVEEIEAINAFIRRERQQKAGGGRIGFYKGMEADKAKKKITLKEPKTLTGMAGDRKLTKEQINTLDPNYLGDFEGGNLERPKKVYKSGTSGSVLDDAIEIRNVIVNNKGNIFNIEELGEMAEIFGEGSRKEGKGNQPNARKVKAALEIAKDNFPEIGNFKFVTDRYKIDGTQRKQLNMVVDTIKAYQSSTGNDKLANFLPENMGMFYKKTIEKGLKKLPANPERGLYIKMYNFGPEQIRYISDRITDETGQTFTSKDYKNLVTDVKKYRNTISSNAGQLKRAIKMNADIKKLYDDKIIQNLLKGDLNAENKKKILNRAVNLLGDDISVASKRLFMMAQSIAGTRPIEGITEDPNLGKKIIDTQRLIGKVGNGYAFSGLVYDHYGKIIDKALNSPKGKSFIGYYQQEIKKALDNGLVPDEIFSVTASARRGMSPYAIFTQALNEDVNSRIKGAKLDSKLSTTHRQLQEIFQAGGKTRTYNQLNTIEKKKVNDLVSTFENAKKDVLKDLKPEVRNNIQLASFDLKNPPKKAIANYASFDDNLKKAFDTSYKNVGYSMSVPKEFLTQKQLLSRLQPPGSGAVTLGALDVGSMFKRLSPATKKLVSGAGGFILPEVLFYQLDKRNRMSKGQSEKEAAAGALESGTLGAYENKAYMEELRKVAESMNVDSNSFDSAYQLNLLTKNYEQNNANYEKNFLQLLEMGDEKRAEDLKKNFERYTKEAQNKYSLLANNISDNVMNTVGASPLIMKEGRENITQQQFQKPFFDMQDTAIEKLKREKQKAFPTQSRQVDTAAGKIGEGFYQAFDSLTQGAKNLLKGRVIPFASKIGFPQYEPLESDRQREDRYLKEMDPRELFLYNKERGFTYDQPITAADMENLQDEQPGLFAGGGIAKLAGVSSGPPPESGPNSQGLPGLLKRVRNL